MHDRLMKLLKDLFCSFVNPNLSVTFVIGSL